MDTRIATKDDLPEVLDFYHLMIDAMAGTEFDAEWARDVHPSDDYLANAIASEELLIGRLDPNGPIVSALVMDSETVPGYEAIPWTVDAPLKDVAILHVVGTDPSYHGKGLATQLVLAALNLARDRGYKTMRLDTFDTNYIAQKLYERLGFNCLGVHPILYEELGVRNFMMYDYDLSVLPKQRS